MALDARACGLVASAQIIEFLAAQSARQCGPCLNGLPRIADVFRQLASGAGDARLVIEVERLSRLVQGRGACHHPDGSVRLVSSALRTFQEDVHAHLAGTCLARSTTSAERFAAATSACP
jgi:NADH:ubiquinone oxidoreductase subunit F (NADH-binding)